MILNFSDIIRTENMLQTYFDLAPARVVIHEKIAQKR